MTQKDNILEFLKTGNPISPLQALNWYGCFRLGAIIFSLKQEGWDIESKINTGNKKYAIYRLKTKTESNGQQVMI